MRRIRIAVIDGSYIQRRETLKMVDSYIATNHLNVRVEWFSSGTGLLEAVRGNGHYDIYLIEPMMPDYNGIKLVRELRSQNDVGKFIFLSENNSYAYAAFEVRAFDYIAKPIDQRRFYAAMDRAMISIMENTNTPEVDLELEKGYIRVPASNISHVDIVGRALCYHLADGKILLSKKLRGGFRVAVGNLLEQPWYVLAAAGCIINVENIKVLGDRIALMTNGDRVNITKKAMPLIRQLWRESRL